MEGVAVPPTQGGEAAGEPPPLRAVIDTSVLFSPQLRAELQELAFQDGFGAHFLDRLLSDIADEAPNE